uniref:Uncharacterized protein n=1 Tax=Plectus sambesii TaxID=2011161 RepID=A0A914UN92_9BILA
MANIASPDEQQKCARSHLSSLRSSVIFPVMGAALCQPNDDPVKLGDVIMLPQQVRKANIEIEKKIKEDMVADRKVVKLLLLGSSDSGKSTIAKQMRILHMNGFDETELINFRYLVYANIITCLQQLISGIKELDMQISDSDKEVFDRFNQTAEHVVDAEAETLSACKRLWKCETTQAAFARRHEFNLADNAEHFLGDISRMTSADFFPTDQDILHCRVVTTGVHELSFEYRNKVMRLIDVGGQTTERRKWIHCFEDVTAILFIIAMSGYDQMLAEDLRVNRLTDSLQLFNEILSNTYLLKSAVILFMNKKDIFERKIAQVPLSVCFNEYKGANTYEEASTYINDKFRHIATSLNEKRKLYSHFTNATDTKNIDYVFGAACDIIFQKNMDKAGMT